MVTQHAVYAAIADPTRRAILDSLRRGERSAGQIADLFPVSRPAISRHLRVLRNAGLLTERRDGQLRIYALNARPLREVEQWLQHYRVFWGAKLHDLRRYVASPEGHR